MPPPTVADKEFSTKLIEAVKNNPVLYNKNHTNYLDVDVREGVWQKIGEELHKPALLCKMRWINIRDNMRRKLKERLKKPNQTVYKYKYEDALDFIMPFFKPIYESEHRSVFEETMEYLSDDETSEMEQSLLSDDVSDTKPTFCYDPIPEAKPAAATVSTSYDQSQAPVDPISIYLETVGATLRTLNPYYLNQAKTKIFQVLQECELQQIVNKGEHPPLAAINN